MGFFWVQFSDYSVSSLSITSIENCIYSKNIDVTNLKFEGVAYMWAKFLFSMLNQAYNSSEIHVTKKEQKLKTKVKYN